MSSLSPASSEFSMSISSVNSKSCVKASKKSSVKSSQEYRSLRLQLFHLQSTHSALKLVHGREMIAATGKRAQLQEEINRLKEQVDELRKDQLFMLESEKEAIEAGESLKAQNEQLKLAFTSQLKSLEAALEQERELKYSLQAQLTKTKISAERGATHSGPEPEDFASLLNEWKGRVMNLTSRIASMESEGQQAKPPAIIPQSANSVSDDPETLRQKILSTYVSLESAQSVLQQRRAEADRLAQRIGNVKILEEKYRDALVRIKRLEAASSTGNANMEAESRVMTPPPPPSPQSSDLKLIQLAQDLGSLKESLALQALQHAALQADFDAAKTEAAKSRSEAEEARRAVLKLQNNLKVKESAFASLKEQLDSTVGLLTETLKKNK